MAQIHTEKGTAVTAVSFSARIYMFRGSRKVPE